MVSDINEFNLAILEALGIPKEIRDRATGATLDLRMNGFPALVLRTLIPNPDTGAVRQVGEVWGCTPRLLDVQDLLDQDDDPAALTPAPAGAE